MVDQVPLLVATGNGHTDIVQLLVQHGANVNTQVCSERVNYNTTLIKFPLFLLSPSFLSSLFLLSLSSLSSLSSSPVGQSLVGGLRYLS